MSILGRTLSARMVAALAAVLVISALLPVMTTSPSREITLVAKDMAFYVEGDLDHPNPVIEVKAGEQVRVRLVNMDRGMTHDFAVPALKAAMDGLTWNEQGEVQFSVPRTPGTYEYVCRPHVPMMKGTLRVVPVTLRSVISTPQGKRQYVRRLFTTIADRYDFITVALSYGQDRRWKRRLIELARLAGDDTVLDLACGTGDLCFAAATRARSAVGLDITHRMVALAARRARVRPTGPVAGRPLTGPHVSQPPTTNCLLVQGDMLALPFPGARFTVVTTGYGLRNVPDLRVAIAEIHRVLAPGGRLLSLDFNRPSNVWLRAAYLTYLTVVGSALGIALHRDPDTYRYIPESIRQYPGATGVCQLLEEGGFTDVRALPVLGGLMAIHLAKKESATGS